MILNNIIWFQAGENMKASEWIRITEDPEIMRCDSKHPNVDGVIAYINNKIDYLVGDRVPVYLIIKEEIKEYITCPKCNGRGCIEKN